MRGESVSKRITPKTKFSLLKQRSRKANRHATVNEVFPPKYKRKFPVEMNQVISFIWPESNLPLQLNILLCILLLAAGRALNIFVPVYNKRIVDCLSITPSKEGHNISMKATVWKYLLIWIVLKFLQGGVGGTRGLISAVASILWKYLQQYTTRKLEITFFAHLHRLSSSWHSQRQTGMVLGALDRGSGSIRTILEVSIFYVLPAIADILIAIVYVSTSFNKSQAITIGITAFTYLYATHSFSGWRSHYLRAMNEIDNRKRQRGLETLLNSDTVKEYVNEEFEIDGYANEVRAFQKEEIKFTFICVGLDLIHTFILTLGIGMGCWLTVLLLSEETDGLSVGDYALISTYIMQILDPLNHVANFYTLFLQLMVDIENMFDILNIQPEIIDGSNSSSHNVQFAELEFRNITFGYSMEKTVLKNVSFKVPAGQTVAIVGPSGSGKTSILRLLLRLYESRSGEILINGREIPLIKLRCLRNQIGIVPQDTVLFNSTIRYNISYGSPNASLQEIMDAARVACIHDKITSFRDQYETQVGERGIRLSGGEKQRVALARLILKNSKIIILDEATSALDTKTEQNIHSALKKFCQNRTTIIVTHRLLTTVDAHTILFLKGGRIIERGTHTELMNVNSNYAAMYVSQFRATKNRENNNNAI